ncbi:MAG TPA: YkgJ family cysteine cluster protein [Acidimicrobiales bacterium]|nr:YkgJ family cysteine cluster protein [Acidimicrobiales bacterium]
MSATPIDAGPVGEWVTAFIAGQRGSEGVDVPCGSCTACCRSSYFIHVAPDETDTLRRIPKALLFPAPGAPRGTMVLGYDDQGRCPMLVDDRCSIYEHRPRACRRYDCRVFAATGIDPADDGKADIAAQAARWRFGTPAEGDRVRLTALRAATEFLRAHPECLEGVPTATGTTSTQALAALAVHHLFLAADGRSVVAPEPVDIVAALRTTA